MGTWGPGNLDSDGALDEIATRSHELMEQLWTRLGTQESWEADEYDHDALFVDFETLFALEAAGVFEGQALPSPEEVAPVRTRWIEGWDAYFDGLSPKGDFKAQRRAVIDATFDRFVALCEKHQRE
jgi:hypothetical protein